MSGVAEDAVLKSCLEYLDIRGIYHWRQNTGALKVGNRFVRFGIPGVSDILGILPDGRFLAVECKRPKGGVLSPCQKDFLGNIQRNGGVAIVAHSASELHEELERIWKEIKK